MASRDLTKATMSRRCISEPPLLGSRPFSTNTQRTAISSTHSVDGVRSQSPKQKLNMSTFSRGRPVVRASTFPLLPTLNTPNKPQSLRPINDSHNDKLPSFKNNAFYNREKILSPHQRGLEGRKFQLRSRYIEIKEPAPPKHPAPLLRNPLRKRVQEIGGCLEIETDIRNEDVDDGFHFSPCQTNLRRLSVITEKSGFSKTSKTLLLDLEEENDIYKSALPSVSVGKEFRRGKDENNNFCDKNSKKLQEHLQITGKQFDPLETKAALLSNWFQSLQSG